MHHIHVTKYENGKQTATSLYGFRGIPDFYKVADEANKRAAEVHAMLNRFAPAGTAFEVEATGTPEWFARIEAR
jgi:hypothetical protein